MKYKKYTYLLFGSALINAFLIGTIASHFLTAQPKHMPPPPHKHGLFQMVMDAKKELSPASQELISQIIAKEEKNFSAVVHDMEPQRSTAKTLLTAKKLDIEKLKALHTQMEQSHLQVKIAISHTFEQIAIALPDEERIRFFEKVLSKPPMKRKHKKGEPPHGKHHF